MDGFVVLVLLLSAICIWILSLFIVLVGGANANAPKFPALSSGKRKVLFVIAHPDDESMFFSPTILHLTSEGHRVHVLCLSTGNADGEGSVRKIELYKACSILKIPFENVKVVDLPALQDGFSQVWSHQLLAKVVEDEIISLGVNLLITFDKYGVSHHPNHCDVHYGICMLLRDKARNLEAWELVTTSIIRKYSGPVDIWLAFIYIHCCERQQLSLLVNNFPRRSFFAMAKHGSQWVWFRKLFVVFSSYTYVNTLRKINV